MVHLGLNRWREGHPPAKYEFIPIEDRCPDCAGDGTAMSRHRFIGGHSYIACHSCSGSGRRYDATKNAKV